MDIYVIWWSLLYGHIVRIKTKETLWKKLNNKRNEDTGGGPFLSYNRDSWNIIIDEDQYYQSSMTNTS